jgi:hypothetical protein
MSAPIRLVASAVIRSGQVLMSAAPVMAAPVALPAIPMTSVTEALVAPRRRRVRAAGEGARMGMRFAGARLAPSDPDASRAKRAGASLSRRRADGGAESEMR